MASRTFEEIKSAYDDNVEAARLEGPASRLSDGDTLLHVAALRGNEDDVADLFPWARSSTPVGNSG